MKTLERIIEQYPDEEFLIADGFDEAIVGVNALTLQIIYNIDKIIDILISEGMTEEEAIEHFEFNVLGAYVGEQTPIFIRYT